MCLQRKKVHGVLRGAVRSVSKRLAVYCIATPVLPLQRVSPQTMRPKQDRKLHSGLRQGQATRLLARSPVQRPATDWGRHTAAPDALKIGHCKQTFTDFNVLPTQYDREKENRRLRQGQAMRFSARYPAQCPASHWGRHTAGPDALKTGHSKEKFTEFNVVATQYNTEKWIGASAKARRRAFRHIALPSVWRQGKTLHLFKHLNKSLLPLMVEGPATPPPSSAPRALTGARRSCSHVAALLPSITLPKQALVAVKTHAPLWVRHEDVDSTHHRLMGD